MFEDIANKDESIDGSIRPETTVTPWEDDDETKSISELSSSFQHCFRSINNQNRKAVKVKKSKEPSDVLKLKPFDYEAAMKEVKFGDGATGEESGSHLNSAGKKKSSAIGRPQMDDDGAKQFPQTRPRAVFPASGNRSATFR